MKSLATLAIPLTFTMVSMAQEIIKKPDGFSEQYAYILITSGDSAKLTEYLTKYLPGNAAAHFMLASSKFVNPLSLTMAQMHEIISIDEEGLSIKPSNANSDQIMYANIRCATLYLRLSDLLIGIAEYTGKEADQKLAQEATDKSLFYSKSISTKNSSILKNLKIISEQHQYNLERLKQLIFASDQHH